MVGRFLDSKHIFVLLDLFIGLGNGNDRKRMSLHYILIVNRREMYLSPSYSALKAPSRGLIQLFINQAGTLHYAF